MSRRRTLVHSLIALAFWLSTFARAGQEPLGVEDYKETIRVACVGDSITFGFALEKREANSYPAVLGKLLGEKFQVRNFGVSASTLLKKGDWSYWKVAAFERVSEFAPHAVVLMLGTNDSKSHNWKFKAEFADDLRAMVDHLGALPSKPRIWLCLPVPAYGTRWGISEEIVHGEIIPLIKQVAAERKLPLIDMYTALSKRPALFPDTIHPNADGTALMAKTVSEALIGK